jgi:hypothetical protein
MMMVIQMKLMKVSSTSESMMIQEFQLNMESQSISLSNLKMHSIQFVSMMMVIRNKLMKVIEPHHVGTTEELELNKESKLSSLSNLGHTR